MRNMECILWKLPAAFNTDADSFCPVPCNLEYTCIRFKCKRRFYASAEALMEQSGAQAFLEEMAQSVNVTFNEMTNLTIIDVLYKLNPSNWTALAEKFPDISSLIQSTQSKVDEMNYFLGLNIADAPFSIITSAISSGAILLAIGALLVPILSALTQYLNTRLLSQQNTNTSASSNSQNDTMASTMKTMNTVMPIMSAVFCFTLPVGMGIYWIAGAVVRCVQQIIINKSIDKIDVDEIVKKNLEKENKKRAKQGLPPQKISNTARINTRNIESKQSKPQISEEEKKKRIESATEYYKNTSTAKPGSLAAKAQMVKQYNEKHAKK